ncbi:interferon-induced 35 kDa protein-like [Arapaima gigas]
MTRPRERTLRLILRKMSLNKTTDTLDPKELDSLEKIKKEIEKYKDIYNKLLKDNKKLDKGKDETLNLATAFQQRYEHLKQLVQKEEQDQQQRKDDLKRRLTKVKNEESQLKGEEERLKEECCQIDQMESQLRQQTQVSTAVPEETIVFTGDISREEEVFSLKSEIVYPMDGGTAFITFEDEEVAQNILSMEMHDVLLGNCHITLEAKPATFFMPSFVEMNTPICPNRILVSNLPKNLTDDKESWVQDRLEVHFSKTRNGGGEVESVCILQDSRNVVIAFVDNNVAQGLVDKEYHEVQLPKKKHKVRVTPFLNGEIKNLQITVSASRRTVLLTGIPDVMEQDSMQDSLEFHFQKASNGGGEVDAIVFNPMGHRTLAVFKNDCPTDQ